MEKTYTRQLKHLVSKGKQFTTDKELAMILGKEEKMAPINFISPKLRETFLRAWPELGLPPVE